MFKRELQKAKQFFPPTARECPLAVHHPQNGSEQQTDVLTWLTTQTLASPNLISALFTDQGEWHYPSFPEADLLHWPLESTRSFLTQHLSPLYEAASHSLDGVGQLGFNRHDQHHIGYVDRLSQSLLDQAAPSWNEVLAADGSLPLVNDATKQRTLIAAWGHDLGNIFSRPLHPFISPLMMRDLFPQLVNDSHQWRLIRRAMILHHETVALGFLHQCWGQNEAVDEAGRQVTIARVLSTLRTHFGPEALALIAADKTDVGRHRISRKFAGEDAIEDPHLEVNLLGYTQGLSLSADETQLVWHLVFDMRLDGDKDRDLLYLSQERHHNPGRKAVVSRRTKQYFDDPSLSLTYFDVWRSLFWRLYFERNNLAIWCLFALFPKLEKVRLEFNDPEINQRASLEVQRSYLLHDFRRLERILTPSNGKTR